MLDLAPTREALVGDSRALTRKWISWLSSLRDAVNAAATAITGYPSAFSTAVLTLTGGQVVFPAVQAASSHANTLDDYEEGTWTPALQFGGAATGMTYGTQTGRYVKVGQVVVALFRITLTAKGTSTGGATITGWPFTPDSIAAADIGYGVTMALLTSPPTGILNTTPELFLYDWGAGGVVAIDDTNFQNATDLIGSVAFRANA